MVLASAGLASNLAALRALAAEGIQRGHMKLHQRKAEAEALLHNGAHTP
jgi:hydroxymethylglutaryl-CoA reductase